MTFRVQPSSLVYRISLHYHTAWKWFKAGKIDGAEKRHESVFVTIPEVEGEERDSLAAVTYSRASSSQNKSNLMTQSRRLYDYATARGYQVLRQVKETGSGLNDSRKQLESLLNYDSWSILVVEHKDRLTRFGFNYL